MAKRKALSLEVQLLGFLDDGRAFVTRRGDVGIVFDVAGVDPDCLSDSEAQAITQSYRMACRAFNERTIFCQYYFRRRARISIAEPSDPVLRSMAKSRADHMEEQGIWSERLVNVLLYLDPRSQRSLWQSYRQHDLRSYFHRRKDQRLYHEDVENSLREVKHRAETFSKQLEGTVPMRVVRPGEAFEFFHSLLNFDGLAVATASDDEAMLRLGCLGEPELADVVCCSGVVPDYDHLRVGRHYTVLLALKDLPAGSQPRMYDDLAQIRGDFHVMLKWQELDHRKSDSELKLRRDHHARRSTMTVKDRLGAERQILKDAGALSAAKELEEVQARMMKNDYLGYFSVVAVAYSEDEAEAKATERELRKVFLKNGANLVLHTYNQFDLLLATIPGGYEAIHPKMLLENTHHAAMCLWTRSASGRPINEHLGTGPLEFMRTDRGTLFNFHLHGDHEKGFGDFAHTLWIARIGSGKTTGMADLIARFQELDPYTLLLDVDDSFGGIGSAFRFSMVQVSEDSKDVRLNPFAQPFSRRHAGFLLRFLEVLISTDGLKITQAEKRQIWREIVNIYSLPPSLRTLGCLAKGLSRELARGLERWVGDGQYGRFFDNAEDCVGFNRRQIFNFDKQIPDELMEPFTMLCLRRFDDVARDDANYEVPKGIFADEAAILLRRPHLRQSIVEAARGLRKRNGFVFLASQLSEDFSEDTLKMLRKLCAGATRIFGSQPSADGDYSQNYGLTEEEVAVVRRLGRGQILLKQGLDRGKILDLCLDPASLALCRTDALWKRKRSEVFAKYGPERGLKELTG